ncbi:ArsC/Spx/MgsR family protein [Lactococcus garvieae]|uniref:ArsC/Spx/MgsR family protein n=1 Tax=Lactococcus garvieae TaxID=1363 RepID=UPI00254C30C6|nr:ArsC/Spx/MgsR family protein [Lactococcus garvieae]
MKNSFTAPSKNIQILEDNNLYLYKKKDDVAVKKVEKWLRQYHLSYELITPKTIDKVTIYQMLSCSSMGFSELLVSKIKAEKIWQCHPRIEMDRTTVSEMVKEILIDPFLLRSPILFDEEKLLAGYNSEEIRKFIPKYYRLIEKEIALN